MTVRQIPTDVTIGAHVIRREGAVTIICDHSREGRAAAYRLLTREERARLVRSLGSAVDLFSWLHAENVAAPDVPLGLRIPGWDYTGIEVTPPPLAG